CSPAGKDFTPYCSENLLVWKCVDDGDGTPQAQVDDCTGLGNGSCDAEKNACVDIEEGGRCNTTEWFCAVGLKCVDLTCVPE
ncbi:MAG: hypothetical protein JRH20_29915, partial [Deltaproteobacteria bacterium]|nr:hypothetical protein [Deltaproteobacteria bacterium]